MKALIVGAGLCGSVIGRQLAEAGYSVEIWDRRDHIAGNMYDYKEEHGILVHKYGPHCFHTNKKELVDFINRFEEWSEYYCTCGAVINKICTPTPFNFKTIDQFFDTIKAKKIKNAFQKYYSGQDIVTVIDALENDNQDIKEYAEFLFENDYSLYTAKQWGKKPEEIDQSILKRVPLRISYKEGYFDDKYQIIPKHSYTTFYNNLLNHFNIKISLKVEALERLKVVDEKVLVDGELFDGIVIYTGAIDELFDHCYGELPYRSLRFDWKYTENNSIQDYPIVAYPQEKGFTRITEYKKLPVQHVSGSAYAVEYPLMYIPGTKVEPYYPLLSLQSQERYENYSKRAKSVKGLFCCGRLADYKYYNMDQALERALTVVDEIVNEK